MCVVMVLFQVHEQYPLIVAANREESRVRPTRPPFRWPGEPAIWAGRDELAGGTWLGVSSAGFLAAVTNRPGSKADPTLPSRGLLCLEVLRQTSPSRAGSLLARELAEHTYNPFNLLCASPDEGWVGTWRGDVLPLRPGRHVLSNRGDLDDARIAVVQRAGELLSQLDLATPNLEDLFAALGQVCANTTGPDPICRLGGAYGTVSSSLIALRPDGTIAAYWHAEGPPGDHPYVPVGLGHSL